MTELSYELAKKLKDAGCPMYQQAEFETHPKEGDSPYEGVMKINGTLVKLPTLEELILSVGKGLGFALYELSNGKYEANCNNPKKDSTIFGGDRITGGVYENPSEAVANLFLTLSSKE